MRASLLHHLGERRHPRRRRNRRAAWRGRRSHAPAEAQARAEAPSPSVARVAADPAVQRVQQAGGPVDCASYTCSCGYLFVAAVSTSVQCPHCGTGQAW